METRGTVAKWRKQQGIVLMVEEVRQRKASPLINLTKFFEEEPTFKNAKMAPQTCDASTAGASDDADGISTATV